MKCILYIVCIVHMHINYFYIRHMFLLLMSVFIRCNNIFNFTYSDSKIQCLHLQVQIYFTYSFNLRFVQVRYIFYAYVTKIFTTFSCDIYLINKAKCNCILVENFQGRIYTLFDEKLIYVSLCSMVNNIFR